MIKHNKDKIIDIANAYLSNEFETIRSVSKKYNVSKSYIHVLFHKELNKIDSDIYLKVQEKLELNKQARYIRGGNATKIKFQKIREEKEKKNE